MGSIPTARVKRYGGCGEVVNTSDCGSDIRGFDSPHSPIFLGYSQAVRQGTLTPSCVGSNPATPVILCRRGGIGRRAGLKIQCPQGRAGSTPAAGIVIKTRFSNLVFFYKFLFLICLDYLFYNHSFTLSTNFSGCLDTSKDSCL